MAANFQTLGALVTECANTRLMFVVLAVTDVAVDLAILIIPMPIVSLRLFVLQQ